MAIDIYVTCKDRNEANVIARHLLKLRLAACVNIFPIESLYWWKEKIVDDNEIAMLIKAQEKNYNKISREIKKIHSYTVPCIIATKINKIDRNYQRWIKEVSK